MTFYILRVPTIPIEMILELLFLRFSPEQHS